MGSPCGFCLKAEQMLHKDIANGKIIKKDSREANGKFQGFPSFICTETGKTHSGLPSSPDELYRKLGVEHYNYMTNSNIGDDPPAPTVWCRDGYQYTSALPSGTDPFTNGIILCLPTTKNTAPRILLYSTGTTTSPKLQTLTKKKVAITDVPITSVAKNIKLGSEVLQQEWSNLVNNYFMKLFPCTSVSDWGDTPKDIISFDKLKPKLLPPQPCSTDSNFYCCPGNDGPKGLNWLYIFILVALILFIILLIGFISRK
jgi:hypothetical protein